MRYYATYCPYGVNTINRDGTQANILYAFPTKVERDTYLERSDPSKVERVLASSPTVKRLLRRPAEEWWKSGSTASIPFMDKQE